MDSGALAAVNKTVHVGDVVQAWDDDSPDWIDSDDFIGSDTVTALNNSLLFQGDGASYSASYRPGGLLNRRRIARATARSQRSVRSRLPIGGISRLAGCQTRPSGAALKRPPLRSRQTIRVLMRHRVRGGLSCGGGAVRQKPGEDGQ
jgi:hypothetical protein